MYLTSFIFQIFVYSFLIKKILTTLSLPLRIQIELESVSHTTTTNSFLQLRELWRDWGRWGGQFHERRDSKFGEICSETFLLKSIEV
jgi:hypothetical protein